MWKWAYVFLCDHYGGGLTVDALVLARIQFALTSMFHYIFPPLSIGIGLFLVIIEGIYLKTKNPLYKEMTKFWVKVFSLTFALGVATGLVQVFGFGTNWATYSRFVGDVFGSALGAEGIFAFFLEAGFLGIMLFGWEKVSPKIHYLATILVTFGAHFSAVWIVAANSWMQTPQGHKVIEVGGVKKAVVTDFWAMILNPSSIDRIVHVILGCWLAGIFLILSITAYYHRKKLHADFVQQCLKIGLSLALGVLILQLVSGDSSAKGVAQNQPSKFAAMEGLYQTEEGSPISLFGWVNEKEEKFYGVKIPKLLSFLTYRNFTTPVTGLDQIPPSERPPINIVFQSYHLMVAMWGLMMIGTLLGLYAYFKKKSAKWTYRFLILSVFFPQIANQVGWMTAEIGRQPWLVYGLMRTSEGVSPYVSAAQVTGSIWMFVTIYLLLFSLFIFLLNHKIQVGPEKEDPVTEYRDAPL